MIYAKTQKIMKTGISKYSKEFENTKEDTQILVTSDEGDGVDYTMCNKWNPAKKVSFKDIMNVRVDLLGFEEYENKERGFVKGKLYLYKI